MALEFLGISGSLRAGSFNSASLRAAAALAPDGMTVTLADIGDVPLFNDDVRAIGIPACVEALRSRITAADGVIIATPEYNYSVPGVLKNVIDWISRTEPQPFAKKPVGIIGASPGAFGTARAQYDLRKSFVFLDAYVMNKPEVMIASAHDRFNAEGELTDQATRAILSAMLTGLRDWTLYLRAGAQIS